MNPPNQNQFWKGFFEEYGYEDISTGLVSSIIIKFLCNEANMGSFNDRRPIKPTSRVKYVTPNHYGGLLVGRLDKDGKINN